MARGRRREVFEPGLGLQLGMAVALVLNAVLLVALLAVAAYVLTIDRGWAIVLIFAGLAVAGAPARRAARDRRARHRAGQREHIERVISRLCMTADVREPAIELVADDAPLSSTTVLAAPGVFVLRGFRAAWHQPIAGLRAKFGLIMFERRLQA